MKNIFIHLIVTVFGIGNIRYAPGTFGSASAFVISYLILLFIFRFEVDYSLFYASNIPFFLQVPLILFISSILVFFLGWFFSCLYIKDIKNHDPSEVVIDEVAGQMLVISAVIPSIVFFLDSKVMNYFSIDSIILIFLVILPFFLFRLFDIFKPWPIRTIEKNFPNAFGVMIDDIVAAIFAIVIEYAIIFIIIDVCNL